MAERPRALLARYAEYPFLTRVFLIFIAISTLPMLFIETHNYLYTQDIIEEKAAALIAANVEEGAGSIGNTMRQYENILLNFSCDGPFLTSVESLELADSMASSRAYTDLYAQINRAAYQESGIRSIVVTSRSNKQVYFNKRTDYYRINENALPLIRAAERQSRVFAQNPTLLAVHSASDEQDGVVFSLTRLLYDIYSNRRLGAITLYLDESVFRRVASDAYRRSGRHDRLTMVMDADHLIFSDKALSPEEKALFLPPPTGETFYQSLGDRRYLFYATPVEHTGWTVLMGIDSRYITDEIDAALRLYMGITALSLLLIGGVFLALLSRTRLALGNALDVMKRVGRGHFEERLDISPQNEFTRIADGFNTMTGEINQLMNELQREKETVREAIRKEKNAEIQALEAQINPHFIYNTIDTINWRAIEKEEYEISDMLKKLANILRYSISRSNRRVTVYQEVDWLREYLFLQRYRFSESFRYEIAVDERMMEYHIHKLLLQPIVENAVIHAFSGRDAGGVLRITGRLPEGDLLEFEVEDNGRGMSGEQIAALTERHAESERIGIRNVMGRLRMYYGDHAALAVVSAPGEGTKVTVRIPATETDAAAFHPRDGE